MERKKLFVRIGIGAAGVLLLVAVFAGVSMVGERNHLRQGIEEGFELRGTYQLPSGASITFQVFDAERSWEAQNGPDGVAKGTFKETADPNIYLLEDERGEETGWVHLAYANGDGGGTLYVRYGSGDVVEMGKVSRTPIYQARG
ncbi:hypothetical protein H8S61_06565 [Eggerthella sp. NSJ-70]|uniref:Uncharacterized protein n=1 Tax=Eggerthella hominis TaxID=2763043 RepID=A0ABR7BQF7_9ACTN|nr:hypothetical protein [Eggerthella hominis]MBC5583853.1 hypothetical protein [Eggerthella hominis]